MKAERGSGGTDPLLFNHGAGWGWVVKATPQESDPYALCMRLGGPLGRSGMVLSILSPAGFEARTVQHVASRYTDFAIPAAKYMYSEVKL